MKNVFQILIAFATILFFSTMTSCTDKCKNMICQNGGGCMDGTCNCVNGYTGKNCEIAPTDFDITASPITGYAPLDVTATCDVKSGILTSYDWRFGDGGSAAGKSVSHRYTNAGSYTIELVVASNNGERKTKTQSIEVKAPLVKPTCSVDFSPKDAIMVNQTAVQFRNLSTGTYTTSSWTFGTEARSDQTNPSYKFTREGVYGASLTVTGPLGSSSCSQLVTVHAMPPTCRNYTDGSSQSKVRIQNLRNAGLKLGQIVINNNYNNVTTKIELYHPDEWLAGRYSAYANLYWSINKGTISGPLSGSSGSAYNIGNDWGIKAIFSDGSESCIRSVHSVATYSNNKFTVKVSDIYD